MLSSLTWHQYLLAAGAATGIYYLTFLLLGLREELLHMLKGKANRAGLPAVQPTPPQVPIMGLASTGAGPPLSEAATILVAPQQPTDYMKGEPEAAVVEAVLQEMKPLLDLATEADAEKEELLPLLRLAAARHTAPLQDRHRKAVEQCLQAQGILPWTLTPEDLQSLWTETPSAP